MNNLSKLIIQMNIRNEFSKIAEKVVKAESFAE